MKCFELFQDGEYVGDIWGKEIRHANNCTGVVGENNVFCFLMADRTMERLRFSVFNKEPPGVVQPDSTEVSTPKETE